MPTAKSVLGKDVARYFAYAEGTRLRRTVECACTPGLQAVVVFRFGHWLGGLPLPVRLFLYPPYLVLNLLIKISWGIDLPRSAMIGPGLYIGHYGGVVISPAAVIGKNCNLSQNITIGVSGQGDKRGVPVIGDNVYVAPGARIFGKVRIGNNVKIGANAVIHRDIPDDANIVLDPGFKIVSFNGNPNPVQV